MAKEFGNVMKELLVNSLGTLMKSPKLLFSGSIFKSNFFQKNLLLFGLIAILAMCKIALRYSCEMSFREISLLEVKLKDVKNESQTRTSDLLGMGKQSRIQGMIGSKDSSIAPSKTPPILIE